VKSHLTRDFIACFARLPPRVQEVARKNYNLWKQNPCHPSLQFKRVGQRKPVYSVRAGLGWRALGLKKNDIVVWFWIGSHAVYDGLVLQM